MSRSGKKPNIGYAKIADRRETRIEKSRLGSKQSRNAELELKRIVRNNRVFESIAEEDADCERY